MAGWDTYYPAMIARGQAFALGWKFPSSLRSEFAYKLITGAIALVLLIAAGLKGEALVSRVGTASLWTFNGALQVSATLAEWLVACWLLAGIAKLWASRAALVLIVAFLVTTAWHLSRGDPNCGCFGRLSIGPSRTFIADLLALAGLCVTRPSCTTLISNPKSKWWAYFQKLLLCMALGGSVMAGSFLVGKLIGGPNPPEVTILLAPNDLLHRPFPLTSFVAAANRNELIYGDVTVIVFSHNCDSCLEYLRHANQTPRPLTASNRTLAIDIAPRDQGAIVREQYALFSVLALESHVICVAHVPLLLRLHNGIVQEAQLAAPNSHSHAPFRDKQPELRQNGIAL